MNPALGQLQPYPFERLKALVANITPAALPMVNLSIGEPKHATPALVVEALLASAAASPSGLSQYPATGGEPALRQAIANWLQKRFLLSKLDPATQVLPINGSREALFALAQTVIDPGARALVVSPNPFYQIYEGAAILAGATPYYVDQQAQNNFECDWASVPAEAWARTQLLYVCSPGNPTGSVMGLEQWKRLFELADQYNFVIAADECYSEIYLDESHPPLGALQAAQALGRDDFRQLIVFGSLSKRSSVPGLRSGYVAGEAKLIKAFLLYRTYHGSAMGPAAQAASVAAWGDEQHVIANRRLYREKFAAVTPMLQQVMDVNMPDAGFYLWGKLRPSVLAQAEVAWRGVEDQWFVAQALQRCNVHLLPGSFLARTGANGLSPGAQFVRVALVEPLHTCVEGARRLVHAFAS
jgi:N-succinyldiaminopimelate aminotransferase